MTAARMQLDESWYALVNNKNTEFIISREEFDWALDIVRTRAFKGDFSEGAHNQRTDDYALLPFIDDLNHRESRDASGTFPPVEMVIGRTSNAICWVPNTDRGPGNEVAHAYLQGPDANAEAFLHEWGFSPPNVDAFDIYVHDIRCVVRGDGRIEDQEQVLASLRRKLQPDDHADTSIVTDKDVWQCILEVFRAEADVIFAVDTVIEAETMSPQRRAIARVFFDAKQRLLQAGMEWVIHEADKSYK
jgi:hypothetical protein